MDSNQGTKTSGSIRSLKVGECPSNSNENLGRHHSCQRGVQYEFGPKFIKHLAQKADCPRHKRTLSKQKLLSDAEADILAQEQVKDKLLYQ